VIQPGLTFDETLVVSSGLFSRFLLDKKLGADGSNAFWNQRDQAVRDALQNCYRIWGSDFFAQSARELDAMSEADTCVVIQQVMDECLEMSSTWRANMTIQRRGSVLIKEKTKAQQMRPDYVIYGDGNQCSQASGSSDSVLPVMIGEAKRWGKLLGRGAGKLPGEQLLEYLKETHTRWGFTSNLREWRLYRFDPYRSGGSGVFFRVDLHGIMELYYRSQRRSGFSSQERAEMKARAERLFKYFFMFFSLGSFVVPSCQSIPFADEMYTRRADYSRRVSQVCLGGTLTQALVHLACAAVKAREKAEREHLLFDEEMKDSVSIFHACVKILLRILFAVMAERRGLLPVQIRGGQGTYWAESITKLQEELKDIHVPISGIAVPRDSNTKKLYNDSRLWKRFCSLFEILRDGATFAAVGPNQRRIEVRSMQGDLFAETFLEKIAGGSQTSHLVTMSEDSWFLLLFLKELLFMRGAAADYNGPIDFGDLEPRFLGDCYEPFMKSTCVFLRDQRSPVEIIQGGKTAQLGGAFYTPDAAVVHIVKNALGPIVKEKMEASSSHREAKEAILSLRVCDPAMGSGHFLIFAADFLTSAILSLGDVSQWESSTNTKSDAELEIRVEVIKHCIYGVDVSPIAVDLAKCALYLSMCRDASLNDMQWAVKALPYLDLRLRCGDSLLGCMVFRDLESCPKTRQLLGVRAEASQEQQEQEQNDWNEIRENWRNEVDLLTRWQADGCKMLPLMQKLRESRLYAVLCRLCDVRSCSEGKETEIFPCLLTRQRKTDILTHVQQSMGGVSRLQKRQDIRYFHWFLEFPEIFAGSNASPGFDAVIGNPPWKALGQSVKSVDVEKISRRKKDIIDLARVKEHLEQELKQGRMRDDIQKRTIKVSGFYPLSNGAADLEEDEEDEKRGARGKTNLALWFTERGFQLVKKSGIFSFIVTHSLLGGIQYDRVRAKMFLQNETQWVIQFPENVIWRRSEVGQGVVMFSVRRRVPLEQGSVPFFSVCLAEGKSLEVVLERFREFCWEAPVGKGRDGMLGIHDGLMQADASAHAALLSKLFKNDRARLSDIIERMKQGDLSEGKKPDKDFFGETETGHRMAKGNIVSQYRIANTDKPLFVKDGKLRTKAEQDGGKWKALVHLVDHPEERIVVCEVENFMTSPRVRSAVLPESWFCGHTLNVLTLLKDTGYSNHLLVGLLNSRVFDFMFRLFSYDNHVSQTALKRLPIPRIPSTGLVEVLSNEGVDKLCRTFATDPCLSSHVDPLLGNEEEHYQKALSLLEKVSRWFSEHPRYIERVKPMIDHLVACAYGLTREEHALIDAWLERFHPRDLSSAVQLWKGPHQMSSKELNGLMKGSADNGGKLATTDIDEYRRLCSSLSYDALSVDVLQALELFVEKGNKSWVVASWSYLQWKEENQCVDGVPDANEMEKVYTREEGRLLGTLDGFASSGLEVPVDGVVGKLREIMIERKQDMILLSVAGDKMRGKQFVDIGTETGNRLFPVGLVLCHVKGSVFVPVCVRSAKSDWLWLERLSENVEFVLARVLETRVSARNSIDEYRLRSRGLQLVSMSDDDGQFEVMARLLHSVGLVNATAKSVQQEISEFAQTKSAEVMTPHPEHSLLDLLSICRSICRDPQYGSIGSYCSFLSALESQGDVLGLAIFAWVFDVTVVGLCATENRDFAFHGKKTNAQERVVHVAFVGGRVYPLDLVKFDSKDVEAEVQKWLVSLYAESRHLVRVPNSRIDAKRMELREIAKMRLQRGIQATPTSIVRVYSNVQSRARRLLGPKKLFEREARLESSSIDFLLKLAMEENRRLTLNELRNELNKHCNRYGLQAVSEGGEGNCFFFTIQDQLSCIGVARPNVGSVRAELCDFVFRHASDFFKDGMLTFGDIIAMEPLSTTPEEYVRRMSRDGEWGDHVMVIAAARCYKVAVRVISSVFENAEDLGIVYQGMLNIGHLSELHYVSLVPLEEGPDQGTGVGMDEEGDGSNKHASKKRREVGYSDRNQIVSLSVVSPTTSVNKRAGEEQDGFKNAKKRLTVDVKGKGSKEKLNQS